ncbi:hypothetical protein CBM2589_U30014 [Cupriavidus taiwanensis]|uniref:Uncharacterized protein n=1 Tax=Cupriavidus taiwanensis TaxID=164546 RepID=A0A375CSJ6_9BURK|nr:hypothetical protein CBM2589_U30014 [Cupriavidus taiwanensis]
MSRMVTPIRTLVLGANGAWFELLLFLIAGSDFGRQPTTAAGRNGELALGQGQGTERPLRYDRHSEVRRPT